jgi:GT2 family glycosyltransferase
MGLALIVVNFNDIIDTKKYVKEVSQYKAIDKIVVVDNLSNKPENAFQLLQELQNDKVDVISSRKNGGYAYGNNFGISYLESKNEHYEYYAISNPDVEISEDAIKRCIKVLDEDKSAGVVAPRMLNGKGKPVRRSAWKYRTFGREVVHSLRSLELLFYNVLRNGEYSETDYQKLKLKVETISGAFFIIKKEAFDKINKFDENVFLFYEEDILAKQLQAENYNIYSLNDVNFKHYESQTIGKTFNYFRKMKELYNSKMYYHTTYTKINKFQVLIFKLLHGIRIIELLIEVPIRKIIELIREGI